ncbi:MAG: tripartite tricarboxylate transporter substrate binding protein [Alphaproteobacteria bacterium]|nr:tripartite tricarboxylate transporter substrate binding protein [Alphaproteobacteria bacterium]
MIDRTSGRTFCVLAALMLAPSAGWAQTYPSKPIRVIVPWPAAGIVDIAARTVGERIEKSLGQNVVIDNRPGAGGMLGAELAARTAPDGYTIALTSSALTMNAALQPQRALEVLRQFEPVVIVAFAPSILVVHPSIPVNSVRELVALARRHPGKLTYASAGNGSPAHLFTELFKSMLSLQIVHVPYKGAPQAMIDQIAGRVDIQFANAAVGLPQIGAGKLRPLAVTSAARFAPAPDVPTMAEAGVANFEADQWLGILVPRGTGPAVIDRLSSEVNKVLAVDATRRSLIDKGMSPGGRSTPESFARYLQQELAKWTGVVEKAQIKLD